ASGQGAVPVLASSPAAPESVAVQPPSEPSPPGELVPAPLPPPLLAPPLPLLLPLPLLPLPPPVLAHPPPPPPASAPSPPVEPCGGAPGSAAADPSRGNVGQPVTLDSLPPQPAASNKAAPAHVGDFFDHHRGPAEGAETAAARGERAAGGSEIRCSFMPGT